MITLAFTFSSHCRLVKSLESFRELAKGSSGPFKDHDVSILTYNIGVPERGQAEGGGSRRELGFFTESFGSFQPVQIIQTPVGIKGGERQVFGCASGGLQVEIGPWFSNPPEDGKSGAEGNDFSTGSPLGGIGPGLGTLLEIEEQRDQLLNVVPVSGVIRLQVEFPPLLQGSANEDQKIRSDQSFGNLLRLVVRLRMIAVNFPDAGGSHMLFEQLSSA